MTNTLLKIVLPLALTAFAGQALAAEDTQDAAAYETIRSGNLDDAERMLSAAHESGKGDPFQLLNLAYVMQKQGRSEDAAQLYKQILEMDENPYAQMASGDPRRVKSIARDGLTYLDQAQAE